MKPGLQRGVHWVPLTIIAPSAHDGDTECDTPVGIKHILRHSTGDHLPSVQNDVFVTE
jgi:hypothetical protein